MAYTTMLSFAGPQAKAAGRGCAGQRRRGRGAGHQ